MNIQSTIAKLLQKRDGLTAEQCRQQIEAIATRKQQIDERLAAITGTVSGYSGLPPERKRVAETGTPAELLALDAEEQLLDAEADSLSIQRDALRERLARALVEESVPAAKAAIKRLEPALKAAEVARAKADQAKAELLSIEGEISSARDTAVRGGLECPGVTVELFNRLAEVLDWIGRPSAAVYPENLAAMLKQRRMKLTDWRPEVDPEPLEPWLQVERSRSGSKG